MVVNKSAMKRKRKSSDVNILLDESPKRTKVQAQRKFAQGSNVNSPVLTPIEEIELPERKVVIPEPQEFDASIKRPPTQDFLTFLCFRGTPVLTPSLQFFNTASVDSRMPNSEQPLTRPSPIATGINLTPGSSSSPNNKPFIAFGVRKRADPIVVSKHMDRKRRQALALQALRRKYQEQKMAKIRAITISKLSEKVNTTKNVVTKEIIRTRSVTKTQTISNSKKKVSQKTSTSSKVKVVATTKRLVQNAQSINKNTNTNKKSNSTNTSSTSTTTLSSSVRMAKIKPKMCLRSFRGRFVQCELTVKRPPLSGSKKATTTTVKAGSSKKGQANNKNKEKEQQNKSEDEEEISEEEEEDETKDKHSRSSNNSNNKEKESSEFSSDDDVPLVKTVKKVNNKPLAKGLKKKTLISPKKAVDLNFRLTRSAKLTTNTKVNRKIIYTKTKNAIRPRRSVAVNKKHILQEIKRRTRSQIITEMKNSTQKTQSTTNKRITKIAALANGNRNKKAVPSSTVLKKKETKSAQNTKGDSPKNTNSNTSPKNTNSNTSPNNGKGKQQQKSPKDKKDEEKDNNKLSNDKEKKGNDKVNAKNSSSKKESSEEGKKSSKNLITKKENDSEEIEGEDTKKNVNNSSSNRKTGLRNSNKKGNKIVDEDEDLLSNGAEDLSSDKSSIEVENNESSKSNSNRRSSRKLNNKDKENDVKDSKKLPKTEDVKLNAEEQLTVTTKGKRQSKSLGNEANETKVNGKKPKLSLEDEDEKKTKESTNKKNVNSRTSRGKLNRICKSPDKTGAKAEEQQEEDKQESSNEEEKEKDKTANKLKTEKEKKEEKVCKTDVANNINNTNTSNKNKTNKQRLSNNNKKEKTESKKESVCLDDAKEDEESSNEEDKIVEVEEKEKEKPQLPQISQRPSRKTKEAATIYMEILSHKLVNEDEIDEDDISIDSFPELPNVRKTEQRENELKAQQEAAQLNTGNTENIPAIILPAVDEEKVEKITTTLTTTNKKKSINNINKALKKDSDSDSEVSTTSVEGLQSSNQKQQQQQRKVKNKTVKKAAKKFIPNNSNNNSFSDSDEEPLSNLTKQQKTKTLKQQEVKEENLGLNFGDKIEEEVQKEEMVLLPNYSNKREKRECAKRPQNYLTIFSSSDDEEKFLGFAKSEPKPSSSSTPQQLTANLNLNLNMNLSHTTPKIEQEQEETKFEIKPMFDLLLCRKDDVGRHQFGGKEKNERIEQWLEDSEKATIGIQKEELKLEIEEKKQQQDFLLVKPKTIFRKEKKKNVNAPNVNAFSVSNESSVYAFEADMEDSSVSTPFRRPSRRASSTATFNSEDENINSTKDDLQKSCNSNSNSNKFRQPNIPNVNINLISKVLPVVNLSDDSHSNSDSIAELSSQSKIHKSRFKLTPEKNVGLSSSSSSMFPPGYNSNNTNKKNASSTANKKLQQQSSQSQFQTQIGDLNDDFKYKVPSSPSASSSSSAKVYNSKRTANNLGGKQFSRSKIYEFVAPSNLAEFPSNGVPQIVEAPVFYPTEKEFQDPIEFIEKIRGRAEKFGICRIVPPSSFKPECKVSDDMRFTSYNQYVNKMLHRWGPNFKELMAIKKYLKTQNITLNQSPWIGGMEVDLPRLYQTVQSLGGLKEVIEKKKWAKVSDAMKIPKSAQDRVTKLDDIYCKYLLPYDTLSPMEREKLFDEVETAWAKRESRTLVRAQQKLDKTDSNSRDSESESEDEFEECIVKGRNMALNGFYRIARNTMSMWFKNEPTPQEVEQEFWKHVTLKQNHICVHSGSIDSGSWGYGFAVTKNSPFARHAWNLKVLTNNSGSVLRSMGPLMGVTVPTLHVGMVFSTCCWYRDPHGLPWIEYLHTGGRKIWYGIPDSMSKTFHEALLKLVPNYCRNKSIWLPSDTVMIPPNLLVENGVSLCRTVQQPGEYIIIFPKVFTSSLSTGYVVSESVYIAPPWWLHNANEVFEELRANCEPSMFSFDRLIISIALDSRSNVEVLKQVLPALEKLCAVELSQREAIRKVGVMQNERLPLPDAPGARKKKKPQGGSSEGDYECEVCRTNLFVTLVNETQDDLFYCLKHALEIINDKKVEVVNCKLLFTYDDEELKGLLNKLNTLIQSKLQKKTTTGKFAGMPTLLK